MMPRDKIPYNLDDLLIRLVKKAQEDGYISHDEAEVIHQIQLDVRDLEKEIMNLKKENPDQPTKNLYKVALQNMIEKSVAVAQKDGVITNDEAALIDILKNQLENL
ncbi:MAG: hypothetical protein D6732_22315 [Methanobacteriota archaeon]|nr:MAG: hypothetical protein D6732_22315 [Euryarchaeota archaeon]